MPFQTTKLVMQAQASDEKLTSSELEFLLKTLKDCHFRGEDVELLYNLIIKIQKQYLNLQSS